MSVQQYMKYGYAYFEPTYPAYQSFKTHLIVVVSTGLKYPVVLDNNNTKHDQTEGVDVCLNWIM